MKMHYLNFAITFFSFSLFASLNAATGNKNSGTGDKVLFTENRGQVSDQYYQPRPDVLFSGRSGELTFHLRKEGVSYQLYRLESTMPFPDGIQNGPTAAPIAKEMGVYRTDLNWIGINEDYSIVTEDRSAAYYNYYLTHCSEGITNVAAFGAVTYQDIYDGIDLKWYSRNGAPEYDYIVAPGADYRQISWTIEGARELKVDKNGALIISTPFGEIIEEAPVAFQDNRRIEAAWEVKDRQVSFLLGKYDPQKPLRIDPVIRHWGTYLGDAGDDYVRGGERDAANNTYVTGTTNSALNIATTGAHQVTIGGIQDAYAMKFDPNGNLLWGTFCGGPGTEAALHATMDIFSNLYIIGHTTSITAIATTGSHDDSYNDKQDVMLIKLDQSGVRQWATYYGGTQDDFGFGGTADNAGNIYLSGTTSSDTGIATPGAHQTTHAGNQDCFLAKFDNNGVRQWATYHGGSSVEISGASAVDASFNVFLGGGTGSSSGIATAGTHQTIVQGFLDTYVVKFNSSGVLQWGTYYGGPGLEFLYDIAVDEASSDVYLTGQTSSLADVASVTAHQSTFGGGGGDAFLAKIKGSNGSSLWGTYYGGTGTDLGLGCEVDDLSQVYLTGNTASDLGIASTDGFQTGRGGMMDALLAKFDSSGVRKWGTYYGGIADDNGYKIIVHNSYEASLAGTAKSAAGIATAGAYQATYGALLDGFLVKFSDCAATDDSITAATCDFYLSPSEKHTWSVSGTYTDTLQNAGGCDSVITIELTVHTPDTSVSRSGLTFTANDTDVTYQWIDCNNGNSPIAGETAQSFTATANGSYAVIVTKEGCSDTSSCYAVTGVGIDQQMKNAFRIYPNPTAGSFVIALDGHKEKVMLRLSNILGATLEERTYVNTSIIKMRIAGPAGLYFLQISNGTHNFSERIVKE